MLSQVSYKNVFSLPYPSTSHQLLKYPVSVTLPSGKESSISKFLPVNRATAFTSEEELLLLDNH